MSTTRKVITFGIISGLTWSLLVELQDYNLKELFCSKESVLTSLAGILTGVAVSLILKIPLTRLGRWWTLFFGLVSLPIGAFIFGIALSVLNISDWLNGSQYGIFNAFVVGGYLALLSVISFFAIYLFPLAVLTTFILRFVIHFGEKQTPKF